MHLDKGNTRTEGV